MAQAPTKIHGDLTVLGQIIEGTAPVHSDVGQIMGAIVHGSTASTARTVGWVGPIIWLGSVQPTNLGANDIWIDTDETAGDYLPLSGGTMTGAILAPDGTAGAPSYSFSADTNTGLRRVTTDTLALVTAGSDKVTISSTGVTLVPRLVVRSDGTSANLGIAFADDLNTGIYNNNTAAPDTIVFTTGGTDRFAVKSTELESTVPLKLPASDPTTDNQATRKLYVDNRTTPHWVSVRSNSNQSIATATWTPVQFDVTVEDLNSMHDSVTNTTRITAVRTGVYYFTAGIVWSTNSTGARGLAFLINGSTATYHSGIVVPSMSSVGVYLTTTLTVRLAAGDYVEAAAYQSSGASLALNSNSGLTPQTFQAFQIMGA